MLETAESLPILDIDAVHERQMGSSPYPYGPQNRLDVDQDA